MRPNRLLTGHPGVCPSRYKGSPSSQITSVSPQRTLATSTLTAPDRATLSGSPSSELIAVDTAYKVPVPLIDAILQGRCIAFVGAGFTTPAVPSWRTLLERLGERLGHPVIWPSDRAPMALDFEVVGQSLRDKAKNDVLWEKHVKSVLEEHQLETPEKTAEAIHNVQKRCDLLRSIPFKAILTTNFDQWLPGGSAGPDTYWEILRDARGRWWELPTTQSAERPKVPIIKLHGDANGDPSRDAIVLSRSDYRRRLYGEHGYSNFLRAAFAEYTVLFMGVSFTDAYLNELRSETHSLLHRAGQRRELPWGYNIFVKTSDDVIEFFRQHESIEGLVAPEPDGYGGFDKWLKAIAEKTSLTGRLRELLSGERIVWVDANPENNQRGSKLFRECSATVDSLASEHDLDEAKHKDATLIVTQFGYDKSTGDARAFHVLRKLSNWATRPPTIVFAASSDHVMTNREKCLRRGAWEYATAWSELYRLIEVMLGRVPGEAAR